MKVNTSSIGRTEKHLMSQVQRMLKVKLLLFTRNIMVLTRNGELSILTKLMDHNRKDLRKTSDSTATDHSTLSQDSQ
jgi:hypothetical protein